MISVLGAGVAGLCAATELAERGHKLEVILPKDAPEPASRFAGGMLAPFCEGEAAPEQVVIAGQASIGWWQRHASSFAQRGTLVLGAPRDRAELDRFARATRAHDWVDPVTLEPELTGRFARGLFYPGEAHMDPVQAMDELRTGLLERGVALHSGAPSGRIVDCRGLAARDRRPALRAVRGEMLEVLAPDIALSRPVRLLHPRFPCYIVPRADGRYMIGATMVESDRTGPVTVRAAMELLSAAWTLHPGFAEAQIVMTGAGLRPAYPDNLPTVALQDDRIHLNGLYRHGFLMAPVLAVQLAAQFERDPTHAH